MAGPACGATAANASLTTAVPLAALAVVHHRLPNVSGTQNPNISGAKPATLSPKRVPGRFYFWSGFAAVVADESDDDTNANYPELTEKDIEAGFRR